MALRFVKTEAAGNDLVLIDARRQVVGEPAQLAVRVCDRHFGVGGDGLLVLEPSADAAALMRMFNPDGTEDFCGNGLRCAAAYLMEEGEAPDGHLVVRTPRGRHEAALTSDGPRRFSVEVEVLPPQFEPSAVPARTSAKELVNHPLKIGDHTWLISSLAVGTTHTVIFADKDVEDRVFEEISPQIERHEMFPERTSVLWCTAEGRDCIRMRIWERGVGETLACGTGTCAAVVIGRRLDRTAESAEVITRGGRMRAAWDGEGAVRLTGPAHLIYTGEWHAD